MQTTFCGKKITSMLGILPEQEVYFEDEVGNYSFPEKQTLRLKRVMGYEKHRISKKSSTVSEFALLVSGTCFHRAGSEKRISGQ